MKVKHAKGCRVKSDCQGCVRAGEEPGVVSPTQMKQVIDAAYEEAEARAAETRVSAESK